MDEITERYERITATFTERVRGVGADAWDNPSPCEGWTARDVIGHLTGWIPDFFGAQGVVSRGAARLASDLEDGRWLARHSHLLEQDRADHGYRLVVAGA